MTWQPFQPDHAIERVRIIVRLSSPLPVKFVRKLAADGEERRIALGFTSKNLREGHQIKVGPGAVNVDQRPSELLGWDWQKASPSNTPLETLVVERQLLVYENAEYSAWENFISRFEQVAIETLSQIVDLIDISAVSLEYVDRFIFHGDAVMAAPTGVLQDIAEHLPENAANGKDLWHYHRGWFEDLGGTKILVNQNIDAQDGHTNDGKTVRSVQIFTKTELRVEQSEFDFSRLRDHLDDMHVRSNNLFRATLTEEMRTKVGLDAN